MSEINVVTGSRLLATVKQIRRVMGNALEGSRINKTTVRGGQILRSAWRSSELRAAIPDGMPLKPIFDSGRLSGPVVNYSDSFFVQTGIRLSRKVVQMLEPIQKRSTVVDYATNQRTLGSGWVELVLLVVFLSNTAILWLTGDVAKLQLGGRLILLAIGSLWVYFQWRKKLLHRFIRVSK